jgi:hypothetical protein
MLGDFPWGRTICGVHAWSFCHLPLKRTETSQVKGPRRDGWTADRLEFVGKLQGQRTDRAKEADDCLVASELVNANGGHVTNRS